MWNVTTGALTTEYHGHRAGIRSLAWSPDGAFITFGCDNQTVWIVDASTGNLVYSYPRHRRAVTDVAWSHDGSRIVSSDIIVQVWEAI
ncbi:MAG: hypothetical protein H0U76_13300 [Ktedonobacteraceae bacterium]|nr:hypothetical protein [Ktedonobacteraceae bacterium]